MSSDDNRAIALSSSNSAQQPNGEDRRQPMQIYRPPATPLPSNRPVADNVTDEDDEMLGYLD